MKLGRCVVETQMQAEFKDMYCWVSKPNTEPNPNPAVLPYMPAASRLMWSNCRQFPGFWFCSNFVHMLFMNENVLRHRVVNVIESTLVLVGCFLYMSFCHYYSIKQNCCLELEFNRKTLCECMMDKVAGRNLVVLYIIFTINLLTLYLSCRNYALLLQLLCWISCCSYCVADVVSVVKMDFTVAQVGDVRACLPAFAGERASAVLLSSMPVVTFLRCVHVDGLQHRSCSRKWRGCFCEHIIFVLFCWFGSNCCLGFCVVVWLQLYLFWY